MTCSSEMALAIVLAFVMATTSSEAEATPSSAEDISIKTLPPDYARPVFESADALLSDWGGEHWASLDADQDKVALSWTTNSEEAIFQVGHFSSFIIWLLFNGSDGGGAAVAILAHVRFICMRRVRLIEKMSCDESAIFFENLANMNRIHKFKVQLFLRSLRLPEGGR